MNFKACFFLKGGGSVVLVGPELSSTNINRVLSDASSLVPEVVFKGKTDMGGAVHFQMIRSELQGWTSIEMPSGKVATIGGH